MFMIVPTVAFRKAEKQNLSKQYSCPVSPFDITWFCFVLVFVMVDSRIVGYFTSYTLVILPFCSGRGVDTVFAPCVIVLVVQYINFVSGLISNILS